MAKIDSPYGSGKLPAPIPVAQEDLTVKGKVTLTAAQNAVNNILALAVLPADCIPVGYTLNASDLDSNGAPAILLNLGILNAAETAIETSLLAGSTIGQAGGIALHHASKTTYDALDAVTAVDYDRVVGVVIATGAATAAAGSVQLELRYHAV